MKHYVSLDNGINWLTAEEVVSHKGRFSMGHLKIEFISESSPIFRTAFAFTL